MNGQIVLYMECYPLTCSNRLSYFIELTGARVEDPAAKLVAFSYLTNEAV